MNKQEAIEKIYTASWDDFNYKGLIVDVETVNKIIYQIDEPQKVVVPKFVAEWIEANEKKEFYARLDNLIFDSYVHQFGSDMTSFIYGRTEKIKELIFAYEFGYEVE